MPVFLPVLKQNGRLDQLHFTILNVGSRKRSIEDDYASQGWGFFAPNLTIYGFDADADACEAANTELENALVDWKEKHIPLALSNSVGESTLYVTQHPMCSSLYAPNEVYLQRFDGLPELVNLDFSIGIETTTLDHFCQEEGVKTADFLQIDVQGADLHVLEGATQLLEHSVLAVQIEVEFSHLYLNQPLFADVDSYLRKLGFTLFDLYMSRGKRARSPIQSRHHPGQLIWGEAFYFRDLLQANQNHNFQSPDQIFRLACVADAMEFCDYTLELLEYLTLNYGNNPKYNFADTIVQSLHQIPQLAQQGLDSLPVVIRIRDYLQN